jgi:hypothetical protein
MPSSSTSIGYSFTRFIVNEGKRLFEHLDDRTDFRLISVDTFKRGAILLKYAAN